MADAKTKAVATTTQGAVTTGAYDYGEYAGMGMDKVGKDELLIPFLAILQPMSPVVTEGDNDRAKPGRYYNSITGDIYDGESGGVPFQLVDFHRMFIEWIPRESGGGIAGRYQPDDQYVKDAIEANKGSVVGIKLDNGNDLVETYYAYGNILSEDLTQVESFAVLPLKSTNIKPFRTLLTALRMIKGKPPLFAFTVRLLASKEKNDSGLWYQFRASPTGRDWRESQIDPGASRHLLEAAVSLMEMISSGAAKADFANEGKVAGGAGANGGDDGEVPF